MWKRGNIWWAYVGDKRVSSGTADERLAKEFFARESASHYARERLGQKDEKVYSWNDAVDKWLEEKRHKQSLDRDEQRLMWWSEKGLIDVTDIRKITRDMIDGIIRREREVVTDREDPRNTTANAYINLVSAVLLAAEKDWGWGISAPRLRRYQQPSESRGMLDIWQWYKLRSHLTDYDLAVAQFALATGLRMSNCFLLERRWVDEKNRLVTIPGPETKMKAPIAIPLNDTAMEALAMGKAYPKKDLRYWFCGPQGVREHYSDAWYTAIERAELDMDFHTLRHTFNSWLHNLGVHPDICNRLMAHKIRGTNSIYTHIHPEALRPHAEVIDVVLRSGETKIADLVVRMARKENVIEGRFGG